MAYDLIGKVHGHGDALEALLAKLGYRHAGGAWRHPLGRTAVFVGDLIDRGPRQVACVRIVRDMIEAGTAQCAAGNHEFAAIKFAIVYPLDRAAIQDPQGERRSQPHGLPRPGRRDR